MIEIDGSSGEGGGQIVRSAAALAAATGKPAAITNVRAKRREPGLSAQHVAALKAVAAVGSAEIEGIELGSRRVVVKPGTPDGGRHSFDVGTAGSVTLVLQACLPVAFAASRPTDLRIRGGTDVPWAPPADYVAHVFLPLLARMGGRVTFEVVRRGYYPRGGGEIRARVEPGDAFHPLLIEPPGPLRRIRAVAHVANLPDHVLDRMTKSVRKGLLGHRELEIASHRLGPDDAFGVGGAIVVWAECANAILGASALAEKGVPAERLGQSAADALLADLNAQASLDVHASDQMLLYAALARGESMFSVREVSSHAHTASWLIRKFLDVRVEIDDVGARSQVRVRPT